jgi:hypothetical protein
MRHAPGNGSPARQRKIFIVHLLAAAAILTMNCGCRPASGQTSTVAVPAQTQSPAPTPTETVPSTPTLNPTSTRTACEETLARILQEAAAGDGEENNDRLQTLVTYAVHGDQLSGPAFSDIPEKYIPYQQDLDGQDRIWSLFSQIVPADLRTQVTYFIVATDGQYGTRGAVRQMYDPYFWALEVDIADALAFPASAAILIHETGHILTLNDSQVVPNQVAFDHPKDYNIISREIGKCPNYFVASGCSNSYAYINLFVHQFWSDIFPEWDAIRAGTGSGSTSSNLHELYIRNVDQFVSEYAVYSPEEDIAETWSRFILAPRPEGNTVAGQKVLFFYKIPELVSLRAAIISNLCAYAGTP